MFSDVIETNPDIKGAVSNKLVLTKTSLSGTSSKFVAANTEAFPQGTWPSYMTIKHGDVGKGTAKRRRSNITLDVLSVDATSGVAVYGTKNPARCSITFDIPSSFRAEGISSAELCSTLMRTLVGLTSGRTANTGDTVAYMNFFQKIQNGEV